MRNDNSKKGWKGIYFSDENVEATDYYVLFVDVMGMKLMMGQTLSKSLIFVGKLHVAILEVWLSVCGENQPIKGDDPASLNDADERLKVIPVIDGAYVRAEDFHDMQTFINKLYRRLANEFMKTNECEKQFLVRAGLSYGPLFQGKRLAETNDVFSDSNGSSAIRYRDSLAIGLPITQSHAVETEAPPFGVYIDNSVRIKQGKKISGIWYDWINRVEKVDDKIGRQEFGKQVMRYFNWAEGQSERLEYPLDKINKHRRKAEQYFFVTKDEA